MNNYAVQAKFHQLARWILALACLSGLLCLSTPLPAAADPSGQIDLVGPPGSGRFGGNIRRMASGNLLVIDPLYDNGSIVDAGAIYLYDGQTYALISKLTGSHAQDKLGSGGTYQLNDNDYILVMSPDWGANDEGAIIHCNPETGCGNGDLSAANSLVGSHSGDRVGDTFFGDTHIDPLDNGDYVVIVPNWGPNDEGAVTWCSGTTGCKAAISAANSLVGSNANDKVGSSGWVTSLDNNYYVVGSPDWGANDVGAATWCSTPGGCKGTISAANSLVGSQANDHLGKNIISLRGNNHYVVFTSSWGTNDEGAVTWCNGSTGCKGTISVANSLVGTNANDQLGNVWVSSLENGNYVISSSLWGTNDEGAVTWCSGTMGCKGAVTAANSLVGTNANDQVGKAGVHALSNGNYLVESTNWGSSNEGAVTWCSGATGCKGPVSATNSLIGGGGDNVGDPGVTVLDNDNYVVNTQFWGPNNEGASTWCSGTTGCVGNISAANSLVGSNANDRVGRRDVDKLENGSYVVGSPDWGLQGEGASTWCSGTNPCTGVVSSSNSLVGSHKEDWVGNWYITELTNGSYVMRSPYWGDNNEGALTWCSGTSLCTGVVSAAISLVGGRPADWVGYEGLLTLNNGNFVAHIPAWGPNDEGAVTWCSGTGGCVGIVSEANSLVGSTAGDAVGKQGLSLLENDNYVVRTPTWGANDEGAVTWCSGTTGCKGPISAANSLVGSNSNDQVGSEWISTLINGNYVVSSPLWGTKDEGAATWCSGVTGCRGPVSSANSLVGSINGDKVSEAFGVGGLDDGNYVVLSPGWGVNDQGAVSLANGLTGLTGLVNSSNSVIGAAASGGAYMTYEYDKETCTLIVGRPADNTISRLTTFPCVQTTKIFLPMVLK